MIKNHLLTVELSCPLPGGKLLVKFISLCDTELVLRYPSYQKEVLCQSIDETIQIPPKITAFDEAISRFHLKPRGCHTFEIDIHSDYLFPVSGCYKVWIDYDTNRRTSVFDEDDLDKVHVTSNAVEILIDTLPK